MKFPGEDGGEDDLPLNAKVELVDNKSSVGLLKAYSEEYMLYN